MSIKTSIYKVVTHTSESGKTVKFFGHFDAHTTKYTTRFHNWPEQVRL